MQKASLPGLYIHIPFCRTKCPYCDFYSCTDTGFVRDFIAALAKELLCYREEFPCVDTVYLGGGTPTVLPDEALAAILTAVAQHVSIAGDAEITVEANPNDLTQKRLAGLRCLGFNRLSFGVQSFDDKVLSFLGRRHTADEARQAFRLARGEGFENISLDFMYAIPGQSRAAWLATLEEALSYSPEHLSCYQLTIKEGTRFFERAREGALQPCSDDEQAELFLATSEFLEKRGYAHYEVSNFCRAENVQSQHNTKYWEHAPYLGLGPSAHSFDGRRRWWNAGSLAGYISALLQTGGAGALPEEGSEELTDAQLRDETVMLGLRTRRGAALDLLADNPAVRKILSRLEADGLVTISATRVHPTTLGMLMADSMASALLAEQGTPRAL